MLRYYYTQIKDRLYVYDSETGFYKIFDKNGGKWDTPYLSFSYIDRDNNIELAEISEEKARELSNNIGFEKELLEYLELLGLK